MKIKNTIFYEKEWIWSNFLKYLISKFEEIGYLQYSIPSEFVHKKSTYGPRNMRKEVSLFTWAVCNERINLARAVCISSPNYSVLNFLIIPNNNYNIPFFGVDFVSLPNSHLLVLDFQPSLNIEKQLNKKILEQIISMRNICHQILPLGEKMPMELEKFFSPGMIWSKLPKTNKSDILISNQLYYTFTEYLNLYIKLLFDSSKVGEELKKEIINGQNLYLEFRKVKDPAIIKRTVSQE